MPINNSAKGSTDNQILMLDLYSPENSGFRKIEFFLINGIIFDSLTASLSD